MNFKSTIGLLALSATLISSVSCRRIISAFDEYECNSTGPIITRTTTLPEISGLRSSSGLQVTYIQCDTASVTVSAPDDVMELIETIVSDSTLSCQSTKNLGSCAKKVTIVVKSPLITRLSASSGSTLNISGKYNADGRDISAKASSGATLVINSVTAANGITTKSSSGASIFISDISASSITSEASSGSSTDLNGKCENVDLHASSGASVSASSLESATGSASASSGGSISCDIKNPVGIGSSSGGSVHNRR